LITTFSSGASSVAEQIWQDPTQAPTLLAENLPSANNFYLSFFVLQGVTVTASTIFQIADFIMFNIVSPFLDKTPRKKYNRWTQLSGLSWGDTYPKFTTFMVIAIAYSCIAPLVLGFATIGLYLLYIAFRYNVFYVLTMVVDTKGDAYGKAMQHLSVGVYLVELCLIGLFASGGGQGPANLMTLFFILTIIYHTYLNIVLSPLTNTLSDELMAEDEEEARGQISEDNDGGIVSTIIEAAQGSTSESNGVQPRQAFKSPTAPVLSQASSHVRRGGFFAPFLFHGSRSSYPKIREQLRNEFPGQPIPQQSDEFADKAYQHPAINAKAPIIWLARDDLGVSKDEIKACKPWLAATDEGARFNEKGKIIWDQDNLRNAPLYEERKEF